MNQSLFAKYQCGMLIKTAPERLKAFETALPE
jgi:hypothetical protein